MSQLDQIACKKHVRSGFDSSCNACLQAVFDAGRKAMDDHAAGGSGEAGPFVDILPEEQPAEALRRTVMGLVVVASPTIARRAFWALNAAIQATVEVHKKATPQAKRESEEHIAVLRTLMDLMKDCVEKPVR